MSFIINNARQWRVVRVDADGSHQWHNVCDTQYECRATARAFERSRNDGARWFAVHVSHSDEMDINNNRVTAPWNIPA